MAILRRSNGESNVWCKTDRGKKDRGPNGDLGLKGTVVQMAKANTVSGVDLL